MCSDFRFMVSQTIRRFVKYGALIVMLDLVVFWHPPVEAQVTMFADNEARRAVKALNDRLLELELGTKERITAIDTALKAAESQAQPAALEVRRRLEALELLVREAIDRLAGAQRQGQAQWQQALAERDARHEQKLVDAVLDSDQKVQQAEERIRRAVEELSRRADERFFQLDIALRQAQERTDKAERMLGALQLPSQSTLEEVNSGLASAQLVLREEALQVTNASRQVGESLQKLETLLGSMSAKLHQAESQRRGETEELQLRLRAAEDLLRRFAQRIGTLEEARAQ